jgi:hypothetical protein
MPASLQRAPKAMDVYCVSWSPCGEAALVFVRLAEEQVDEAMAIMERHQAVDIEERADEWRARGWTQFKEAVEPSH